MNKSELKKASEERIKFQNELHKIYLKDWNYWYKGKGLK